MPFDTTIRAIALGLFALTALWLILAALGLRPRAIRVRLALQRSGPETLLCGACGHPAVALGEIQSCPECGSSYAFAGLDGKATASHWSPPTLVLGVMLAGVWLLGSTWLAPKAASWGNQVTIGSAQVERWQSRLALRTTVADLGTGQPAAVVAELNRDLLGATTPQAGSTTRPALGGTATLHLMQGPAVRDATSVWENDPITQSTYDRWLWARGGRTGAPSAVPEAGAMDSPWDALRQAAPNATLRWRIGSEDWTLTDSMGGSTQRGTGLDAGISAMAGRLGFEPIRTPADAYRPNLAESLAQAASAEHAHRLQPVRPDEWTRMYFGRFMVVGEITATPTRVLIHPVAPLGVAAAIATSATLLLVALALLWLSRLTRRGPAGD